MSALTKPHIHPTGTIGGEGDMVNIEDVVTVTTVDAVSPSGVNTPDKHLIIFSLRSENNPKEVVWRYEDAASRDTSLGNIKTLASTAIA